MALDERMKRGLIAGRRAGHEVRICRRTGTAHCQGYDEPRAPFVDRGAGAAILQLFGAVYRLKE
jgi:hypothetical protein